MSSNFFAVSGITLSAFFLLHCSSDDGPQLGGGGTTSGNIAGAPEGGDGVHAPAGTGGGGIGASGVGGESAGGGVGGIADGGVSSVGGGGGETACDEDFPECCEATDRLPCKEMSEDECKALGGQYCMPVMGVPYQEGGLGGAGPGYDDGVYIGCFSRCGGDLDVESCTQDPGSPAACYHTPSAAAPDGWTVFDCGSPPSACAE